MITGCQYFPNGWLGPKKFKHTIESYFQGIFGRVIGLVLVLVAAAAFLVLVAAAASVQLKAAFRAFLAE